MIRSAASIRLAACGLAVLGLVSVPGYSAQKLKEKTYGEIRADKALVYFLRVPSWGRGVESLTYVYSDQEIVSILPKKSYSWTYLEPGSRTLWNSAAVRERGHTDLTSTRDVEFHAGQTYYIVLNYRVSPHVFFAFVEDEAVQATLEEARFLAIPDAKDIAAAESFREERFPWIQELRRRRQSPSAIVHRVSDAERDRILCKIHTIFVDEVKVSENAAGGLILHAEDFGQALQKKLSRFEFEAAKDRDGADAMLVGRVDERRQDTPRGYKKVSRATVALQTLDGKEIWSVDVDNGTPSVSVNSFNVWSQLARRVLVRLRDECRGK